MKKLTNKMISIIIALIFFNTIFQGIIPNVSYAKISEDEFSKFLKEFDQDTNELFEYEKKPWYSKHKAMIIGGVVGAGIIGGAIVVTALTGGVGAVTLPAALTAAGAKMSITATVVGGGMSAAALVAGGAGVGSLSGAVVDLIKNSNDIDEDVLNEIISEINKEKDYICTNASSKEEAYEMMNSIATRILKQYE